MSLEYWCYGKVRRRTKTLGAKLCPGAITPVTNEATTGLQSNAGLRGGKLATIGNVMSVYLSVCLSDRIDYLGSRWTDFLDI